MKSIRPGSLLALSGVLGLVVVAVAMAQKLPELNAPKAADAHELSSVFRNISEDVIPGVVSLQVRTRAVQMTQQQLPFDDDHPLNRMFRNDPRLREFFDRPQAVPERQGMGSGFVIDRSGLIMTNAHVVENADEITVKLHDGREFPAVDWKSDPDSDVAVLRIEGVSDLHALRLGDSDQMQIGDWVLAFGSPFGLDLSVTAGIISGKGRGLGAIRQEMLQTDAAINPGNSGGPLVNLRGEVVGINTAISTRSGGYDGVGFAIPINKANWIGEQLANGGTVKRAYLGVRIQPVSNELAQQFQTPPGRGAIVTSVMPGSPAAEASLQPGDVILEIDGRQVNSTRNLQVIVEQLVPGQDYRMKIQRAGRPMALDVKVVEMPTEYLAESDPHPTRDEPGATTADNIGLEVANLSDDYRSQLGLDSQAAGVVITGVRRGSAAARAGLSPGDVIEKVGTVNVASVADYRKALSAQESGEGVLMLVRSGEGRAFIVIKPE